MAPSLSWNEFNPDQDSTTPGSVTDCRGMQPSEKGWCTAHPMSRLCSPLPAPCFGAYTCYLLGTQVIILATASGLYLVQTGAPVALRTGFANTQNRWRFASYGQDLIAVNGVDADQYYRLASGVLADLPGAPPVASLVATTDYSVILVPPNSQTLWSNLSDTASWVPSEPAQVYTYTLAQIAGNITSVQRKRSLLAVYRRNAIQCATFVGGFIGWDFGSPGTISKTVGVKSNEMLINTGDIDYFVGPDDFWQFDGYNLTRIPNHIKEWFFGSHSQPGDLNEAAAQNMVGHYDNIDDLIMWHYPSNSTDRGRAGLIDSVIGFYNRGTPRWFMDRVNVEYAMTGDALNMHALVMPDHSLFVDDDSVPFSPVSNCYVTSQDFGDRQHVWQTKRIMPGFALFPVPGASGQAPARVTPLVQMKVGTPPVAKAAKAISDNGFFNVMATGRLTRFQLNVYGPAELTNGVVDINPTGEV